jgi:hypothetical protein
MRRKAFSWTLPHAIEARLGESTYGRQRAIFEDEHLLIVLHSPPEPDTHRRNPEVFLRKPDGSWWHNGMAGGDAKLKKLLASYRELYERYDDAYEQAASATELFAVLDDLAPLNRAATNLSQALQSARELVQGDRLLIAMRDEAYEVSRSFELLFHDAKLALDYRIARSAEAQMAKRGTWAREQITGGLLGRAARGHRRRDDGRLLGDESLGNWSSHAESYSLRVLRVGWRWPADRRDNGSSEE